MTVGATAELFGRELFESGDVALLLSSLAVNAAVAGVIVGLLYFRQTADRDHAFMMATLNLVVFLVAFFMNSIEVGVGFGFGLFALFGIVRYRTESVPVREMSYLFAVIALGLTNAVGADVLTWVEVLIANLAVVAALGTLSTRFWPRRRQHREIVYDQLINLRPERRARLRRDIWDRTGILAAEIEIVSVNLINDSAVLRVATETHTLPPARNRRTRPLGPADRDTNEVSRPAP